MSKADRERLMAALDGVLSEQIRLTAAMEHPVPEPVGRAMTRVVNALARLRREIQA